MTMIFVNFKTYQQGTGDAALNLVKILEEVATQKQIKIIPVVQAADVKEVVLNTKLEVWVQNVDPVSYGAHTGSVLPEAVREDGAVGTFLNHSEHKFEAFEYLEDANKKAKEIGLKTLIFAGDLEELKRVVGLAPDFVSYEPPELVGSKTTSVSEAKPEIIAESVEISRSQSVPLIVGAGIKTSEDIRKGLELGAVGFAVASSIVASDDPKREIQALTEGFE